MQMSQTPPVSSGFHLYHHQPMQDIDPYYLSHYQILQTNSFHDQPTVSFETKQYCTLESSPLVTSLILCDSPSFASVSSSTKSPFSSQVSQSQTHSWHSESPTSGCCSSDADHYENQLNEKMKELENSMLGRIESWDHMVEMIPQLNLSDVLKYCAESVSEGDTETALGLMDKVLVNMVSVNGDPIQRLGAYLLEGLRARVESSGSAIYKSLKCEQEQPPTSKELLNYMGILYRICPYWQFAYTSANSVITEAIQNQPRIHIIDFQIAQGTQWKLLMKDLAMRPGGPPCVRLTGVDDSQSFHARGGGLDIVGQDLSNYANSLGVPFEFHSAAMSGCEVKKDNLGVRPGEEALVVNFPYVLHHMPDESVSTENHRDRLLRLVKSLSPMVVTLVEQESNTNTSPFYQRFVETLSYYTAMFESIDAGSSSREDRERIKAEQHCVARDIVNMIACEDKERVERHELFGKWKLRFEMAGFKQYPLSSSVMGETWNLLKRFHENYRLGSRDGALYLGWNNRAMATSSAWR